MVSTEESTSRRKFLKQDVGEPKWCEYHKSKSHNADECFDKEKHNTSPPAVSVQEESVFNFTMDNSQEEKTRSRNDFLSEKKITRSGGENSSNVKHSLQHCSGKWRKTAKKMPRERATKLLELVHTHILGPVKPLAKGKFSYSIAFVDEYSGATRVYALRQKKQAHLAFKKFIKDVSPYGRIMKIRFENQTEYPSIEFRKICLKNRIEIENSSNASEQTRVAKKNHQTMFEMAKRLLAEAELPKTLWTYALKTAAQILNRSVNSKTGVTPLEILRGRRPNLSSMQTFGTKCYAYGKEAGKREDNCKEGIFVGHDNNSPAYLIYFPHTKSIKKEWNAKFITSSPEESCIRQPACKLSTPPRPQKTEVTADAQDAPLPSYTVKDEVEDAPGVEEVLEEASRTSESQIIHYCFNTSSQEIPSSLNQAIASPHCDKWSKAQEEEPSSAKKNDFEQPNARKYCEESFNPKAKMKPRRNFLEVAASQVKLLFLHSNPKICEILTKTATSWKLNIFSLMQGID